MKKMLLGLVLASVSLPAIAGDTVTLWQNVDQGMTAEQVEQLYPGGKYKANKGAAKQGLYEYKYFEPIPDCPATVNFHFENGGVEFIELRGKGALGGGCSGALETALVGKYGYPEEMGSGTGWGGMTLTRQQGWQVNGVMMRFHKKDGMGLASASWIMEYVAIDRVGSVGL